MNCQFGSRGWAAVFVTLFALAGTSLAAEKPDPIRVSADFESGSLGQWRVEEGNRLVIVPKLEFDQDHVNSALTWFYGRLDGVLGRQVTIDLEGLDYTVYNGKQGDILPYARNTVPVFSYDGELWERFVDCSFDAGARRLRIRHVFSRDTVWIAYLPPYTLTRLEAFLREIGSHPAVEVGRFGWSVEGRPLYLVTVGGVDASEERIRPVVWVIARQHAFEAGGSWACEGLVRFLLSDDPQAREARQRMVFRICPMMNPDGVALGNTRFNASGVDLNRHWNSADPLSNDPRKAPEIVRLKEALAAWKTSNRLDLFVNLHNNDMVWNDDGDYIRFAPGNRQQEARRLEALLRARTVFSGPFDLSESDAATESVVASETGAVGLLMEMKTGYLENLGRWTGTDIFLRQGADLARVLLAYFAAGDQPEK